MILKRKKIVIQWRKFEIKRSYNFKDMYFWIFWIFQDFSRIYFRFFLNENHKKGVYFPQDLRRTCGARDPRECDTACKATWQSRTSPRGTQVAHKWRGRVAEATRVHADARVAPRGRGAGRWRPHGLVGPGEYIGVVMQGHYSAPHFICAGSFFFLRVGLCSRGV